MLLLFLVGCDLNQNQNEFENQAFKTPENYTKTNGNGEIELADSDDWRVSPLFINSIEVFVPAYPNPTTGQNITIEFLVSGIDAVPGLIIYVLRPNRTLAQIYTHSLNSLPTGLIQISLDPATFSSIGSISGSQGLSRLLFYDNLDRIITYGDIKVE